MPSDEQADNLEPNTSIVEGEKKPQGARQTATNMPEVLPGDLPPEVQHALTIMMGIMTRGSASPTDPLLDKFNDDHINKYLDNLERDSAREHELKSTNRRYYITYAFAALLFLAWVIWYMLPTNAALLSDILKLLIGAVLGFSGGFGFKSYLDRRDQ